MGWWVHSAISVIGMVNLCGFEDSSRSYRLQQWQSRRVLVAQCNCKWTNTIVKNLIILLSGRSREGLKRRVRGQTETMGLVVLSIVLRVSESFPKKIAVTRKLLRRQFELYSCDCNVHFWGAWIFPSISRHAHVDVKSRRVGRKKSKGSTFQKLKAT
jgi:hypothetical protein